MTPDFAQYAVLIVFVGLASIIGAVAGVSNIVKNIAVTRAARDPARTPPLPEELAKVYATKTELLAMREELRSTCKANHEHVDKIHNDIFEPAGLPLNHETRNPHGAVDRFRPAGPDRRL